MTPRKQQEKMATALRAVWIAYVQTVTKDTFPLPENYRRELSELAEAADRLGRKIGQYDPDSEPAMGL
jgi:hypothetical protein